MTVEQIIHKVHSNSIRVTLANIIALDPAESQKLMAEFYTSPDHRFSDNVISACSLYKDLLNKWDHSYILSM